MLDKTVKGRRRARIIGSNVLSGVRVVFQSNFPFTRQTFFMEPNRMPRRGNRLLDPSISVNKIPLPSSVLHDKAQPYIRMVATVTNGLGS